MGAEHWEPSPEELSLPTRTVSVSTSNVPKPDFEEVEARCIGTVCILGNTPLEVEDWDLHERLVASVNVTLDHEVKDQVQIAAVTSSAKRKEEDILFQPSEQMAVKVVIMDGTKPKITADQLATRWNIGLDMAKRTL